VLLALEQKTKEKPNQVCRLKEDASIDKIRKRLSFGIEQDIGIKHPRHKDEAHAQPVLPPLGFEKQDNARRNQDKRH